MGQREVGSMLNKHDVRVEEAEDIAVENRVGKDDGIDKVVIEKA